MQAMALGTAESAVKAAEQREREILDALLSRTDAPESGEQQTE